MRALKVLAERVWMLLESPLGSTLIVSLVIVPSLAVSLLLATSLLATPALAIYVK